VILGERHRHTFLLERVMGELGEWRDRPKRSFIGERCTAAATAAVGSAACLIVALARSPRSSSAILAQAISQHNYSSQPPGLLL
jgi:hypothetical protein